MSQAAFEHVNGLFFDAHGELSLEDYVKMAYERLLGYADAQSMNNAEGRIGYWLGQLNDGLSLENFITEFLTQAGESAGNHVNALDFSGNQSVVATYGPLYANNPSAPMDVFVGEAQAIRAAAEPGEIFSLTHGPDEITGTEGNDLFSAPLVPAEEGAISNSLGDQDILDGGEGVDTLIAVLTDDVSPQMSNIQVLKFRLVDDVTIDLIDVRDAEQVWNDQSQSGRTLTLNNAPASATFYLYHTRANMEINFVDDLDGDSDALSLALRSAGNSNDTATVSSGDAGDIEVMNVSASGNNFVDVSGFHAVADLMLASSGALALTINASVLETLTLSGSGEAELADVSGNSFAALEALHAAEFSGAFALDLSGSTHPELSILAGAGDVRVVIDGAILNGQNEAIGIDLGGGSNTLELVGVSGAEQAGNLDFAAASIHRVQTLKLADALVLEADGTLDLQGLDDLETLVFGADVVLGDDALLLASAPAVLTLAFEGVLDDGTVLGDGMVFGSGMLKLGAAQTLVLDFSSSDAFANLSGDAWTSLTVNAAGNNGFEIDSTGGTLETVTLSASGSGTFFAHAVFGNAEGSLSSLALNDTSSAGATGSIALIETVDLETIVLAGADGTILVIDAIDASFAAAVTLNIGALGTDGGGFDYFTNASNGVREVFRFTGEDIGDIWIDGFTGGVGANTDRLDFSAFGGVSQTDDLEISWDGTNTTVTGDAFAGTITILGVDLTSEPDSFIF